MSNGYAWFVLASPLDKSRNKHFRHCGLRSGGDDVSKRGMSLLTASPNDVMLVTEERFLVAFARGVGEPAEESDVSSRFLAKVARRGSLCYKKAEISARQREK